MKKTKLALKILAGTLVVIAVAIVLVLQGPVFGGKYDGQRLERMQRSPEFVSGQFVNTPPQNTDPSLIKIYLLH